MYVFLFALYITMAFQQNIKLLLTSRYARLIISYHILILPTFMLIILVNDSWRWFSLLVTYFERMQLTHSNTFNCKEGNLLHMVFTLFAQVSDPSIFLCTWISNNGRTVFVIISLLLPLLCQNKDLSTFLLHFFPPTCLT